MNNLQLRWSSILTLLLEVARNVLFLFSSLWPSPDMEKLQKFFQW